MKEKNESGEVTSPETSEFRLAVIAVATALVPGSEKSIPEQVYTELKVKLPVGSGFIRLAHEDGKVKWNLVDVPSPDHNFQSIVELAIDGVTVAEDAEQPAAPKPVLDASGAMKVPRKPIVVLQPKPSDGAATQPLKDTPPTSPPAA